MLCLDCVLDAKFRTEVEQTFWRSFAFPSYVDGKCREKGCTNSHAKLKTQGVHLREIAQPTDPSIQQPPKHCVAAMGTHCPVSIICPTQEFPRRTAESTA
eukprot:5188953-Amphidinium_carterae.1